MAIKIPHDEEELKALSDADLEDTRQGLEVQAAGIRRLRKALAIEAEQRAARPKPAPAAAAAVQEITGAGGIESEEA